MAENVTPPSEAVVVPIIEEKNEAKQQEAKEAKKQEAKEAKKQEAKELPGADTTISKPAKKDKMKHIMLPLTVVSFLLSLPILFSVIWLLYMRQYDCENLLGLPKLQFVIIIGLTIVFFVSNLVVKFRAWFPVFGFLLVTVPLIVMLIIGLGLKGAFNMETRNVPGTPTWLKMKVDDDHNWNDIKSCIYDTTTCRELVLRSYTIKTDDLTTRKLSSIESGCCVPPSGCEMEYVNATYWRKRDAATDVSNPMQKDCDVWQNDETILCYDCQACKNGFLKPLQSKWEKLGTFLIVMAGLLSVSHLLLFISAMLQKLRG